MATSKREYRAYTLKKFTENPQIQSSLSKVDINVYLVQQNENIELSLIIQL